VFKDKIEISNSKKNKSKNFNRGNDEELDFLNPIVPTLPPTRSHLISSKGPGIYSTVRKFLGRKEKYSLMKKSSSKGGSLEGLLAG
jgi:hypothetical protein